MFTKGFTKTARCWKGYKPVKGKKPFSPGSCEPMKKEAGVREDNIKSLEDYSAAFKKTHKMISGGIAGGGAALAAHSLYKRKPGRALLGLAALGAGGLGMKSDGRYSRGLNTIKKHLAKEKVTDKEWDDLAMNNPSGSLMTHVHPSLAHEVGEPWVRARNRVFGNKPVKK